MNEDESYWLDWAAHESSAESDTAHAMRVQLWAVSAFLGALVAFQTERRRRDRA